MYIDERLNNVFGINILGYHTCVTWMFVWIVLFYQGIGQDINLPEALEVLTDGSYACYGCKTWLEPSCRHKPDTVIAVQAIKVGAKPANLECPKEIQTNDETECKNETCCKPNNSADCISDYSYKDADIDYTYHRVCSGRTRCSKTEVSWDVNSCDISTTNSSLEYMPQTNYMFIEYVCVQRSMLFDMCMNGTYKSSNILYLQTPGYPDDMKPGLTLDCSCYLSANTNMTLDIYLIHVQLLQQVLTINGTGTDNDILQYDNVSATMFNITKHEVKEGVNITLERMTASYSGTKIWLGIKARTDEQFTITCVGPSTKPYVESNNGDTGDTTGLIIGLATAGVLFILLALFCCLYYIFKGKDQKRIQPTHNGENGVMKNHNWAAQDSTVLNEKFNTTRIPEEYTGPVRLPPIVGPSPVTSAVPQLQPAVNDDDQTTKKHKKKKKKRKRKHKSKELNEVGNDANEDTGDTCNTETQVEGS